MFFFFSTSVFGIILIIKKFFKFWILVLTNGYNLYIIRIASDLNDRLASKVHGEVLKRPKRRPC